MRNRQRLADAELQAREEGTMDNRMNQREEDTIDLWEIFLVLLDKIPLMIAVGLFTALTAFLVSKFLMTPTYQSTTKIYVLSKQNNDNLTISDLQMGTQLTKDYEELIQSRFVLEEVIQQLSLPTDYAGLKGQVSVSNTSDTRIIAITVTDSNPIQAMKIANAVREAASVHIKNVMDIEAVNVAETAFVPTGKSGPNVMKNTLMGGMVGVIAVAGFFVVLFLMNDTIKTAEDVERYLGLSTLAVIPLNEGEKKSRKRRSSCRK